MSNIVNLRQVRKQNKRLKKEKNAEENRIEFGRSKQEKTISSFENQKANAELDGKKIDD